MRFISVSISGFGPFISTKNVEFSSGVNVICGSNGSGKTNIIDSITWCLFGPTSMSGKFNGQKYEVINSQSPRASVKLTAVNSHGDHIVIHRTLTATSHKLTVMKNSEVVSRKITEGQKIINENLSLVSRESYNSVSSLSSSPILPVSPFISGSSSDRRKIISDLVDPFQENLRRNKQVVKEIKDLKKKITHQKGVIEALRNNIEDKEAQIPDISGVSVSEIEARIHDVSEQMEHMRTKMNSSFDIVSEAQEKIKKIQSDRDNIARQKSLIEEDIQEEEQYIRDMESQLSHLYSERKQSISKKEEYDLYEELNDLIEEACKLDLQSMLHKMEHYRDGYISAQTRLDFMNEVSCEDNCPVCDSPMKDLSVRSKVDAKISSLENAVSDNKLRYDIMKEHREGVSYYEEIVSQDMQNLRDQSLRIRSIREIDSDIQKVEDSISTSNISVRKKKGLLKKYNVALEKGIPQKIKEQEEIINSHSHEVGDSEKVLRKQFNDLSQRKEQLSSDLIKASNRESLADSLMEDLATQQLRFEEEENTLQSCESQMEELIEEKERTGVNGDISNMISDACSDISQNSNDILHRLFPDYNQWLINIISEENKSDGVDDEDDSEEEKTLKITVNGADLSVYSHGEQMRIIISMSIALCEFYSHTMNEWPVPLWDEPSIAIDGGIEKIIGNINNAYTGEEKQFIICTRISDDIKQSMKRMGIKILDMSE